MCKIRQKNLYHMKITKDRVRHVILQILAVQVLIRSTFFKHPIHFIRKKELQANNFFYNNSLIYLRMH